MAWLIWGWRGVHFSRETSTILKVICWIKPLKLAPCPTCKNLLAFFLFLNCFMRYNYSSFLKLYCWSLLHFSIFVLYLPLCIAVISVTLCLPSVPCIHGDHHDHDCHIYHYRINLCARPFKYIKIDLWHVTERFIYIILHTYVIHIYTCESECV